MAREFFKDLPNTTTPLTASRLNGLLNGDEALGSIVVDDVNGKNLFDKGSFVAGDRKDAQLTIRISSRQVLYLEPGTYTFSTDLDTSVYRYEINTISSPAPVSSYDVLYGSGWKTTSTSTITIDNSTKGYFNLGVARINNSSLTISDISSANFQLEKGSTATEYTEYKQPVKKTSVGVKEDTTFYANDFKCRNLFDKNQTFASGTISDSGAEATSPNSARTINYIPVKEGTYIASYTTSNNSYLNIVACYNSSKTFITRLTNVRDSAFTLPSGTAYVRLVFYNSNGITISDFPNNYVTLVQLEPGSEATSYTPYKSFENNLEEVATVTNSLLNSGKTYNFNIPLSSICLVTIARTNGASDAGLYLTNIYTSTSSNQYLTTIKAYSYITSISLSNGVLSVTPSASSRINIIQLGIQR